MLIIDEIELETILESDRPSISLYHIQALSSPQPHYILHIQPTPMQIRSKRSPERMPITEKLSPIPHPVQHDLDSSSLHVPNIYMYIFTNLINFINLYPLTNQFSCPLGERSFPLLASLSPDDDCLVLPVYMAFLDIQELIQPHTTIRKQTDDCLITYILSVLNQVLNLLCCKVCYVVGYSFRDDEIFCRNRKEYNLGILYRTFVQVVYSA